MKKSVLGCVVGIMIVCMLAVTSGFSEKAISDTFFEIQEAEWNEQEGNYAVSIPIRNLSGETLLEPAACVCFLDASDTIIKTEMVQQHGRLRQNQNLVFSALISADKFPAAVYVDYVQYTDESNEMKVFYFDEPKVMARNHSVNTAQTLTGIEETIDDSKGDLSSSVEASESEQEEKTVADANAPSLLFNESVLTLDKGKTITLKPSTLNVEAKKIKFTWESSDTNVVKVTSGKVTAVDGGQAEIICRGVLEDGTEISATAAIKVMVPVKALKLTSSKNLTMKVGSAEHIEYETSPANATDKTLVWTTDNLGIVAVDEQGFVTALSSGKTTITGTTQDGSGKKVQVSVYVPSLECQVSSAKIDSEEGAVVALKYYGKSWDDDIIIENKSKAYDYSVQRAGSDIELHLSPVSVGTGTITIRDKKDSKSKFSINVEVDLAAIPFYRYITLSDARYDNGYLRFKEHNTTGANIKDYRITIKYYDTNGNVLHSGSIENDLNYEFAGMSIEQPSIMKPNDVVNKNYLLRYYPSFAYAEYALTRVSFEDGRDLRVMQDDYVWYSSKTNSYQADPGTKQTIHSSSLSQIEENKANSFMLGYSYYLYYDRELVNYYGIENPGDYIAEIDEGSLFGKAGIKVGDIVISADGKSVKDDYYYVEKAKAKMADGSSVEFVVERPGAGLMEYTFTTQEGKLVSTTAFPNALSSFDASVEADSSSSSVNSVKETEYLSTKEYNQYAALFVGILKSTLKKPDSMELHWVNVMEYDYDLYIVFNITAMNGFGGYNRDTYSFKFEPGHISLSGNSSDYDTYEKHSSRFSLIERLDVSEVLKLVSP